MKIEEKLLRNNITCMVCRDGAELWGNKRILY